MKAAVLGVLLGLSVAGGSHAEDTKKLPEIIIGSDRQQATTTSTCVEVEIGGQTAPPLNCLNQKLRGEVEKIQPSIVAPPVDGKSQDIRVGVVNQSALRQQYGSNFGKSVFPQRPAAPVFTTPLGRR